ncbi:MAG: glycosyltransferase family 2 protein [Paludibacter sp.]
MFSVIIPLYNKAAYVEKAIQSVLSQTFREFELLVVDDGSTDDPLPPKGGSMAERLEKLGVLTPPLGGWGVFSQSNQGVSTARNNGVKLSKYDYIAFLDADDCWEPTYLEEMKGLIEEFPEAGIYGCGYYIVKNGKKRIAPIGVEPDFSSGIINYCKVYAKTLCMPLWTGATIIRKTIFESEQGFKSGLKLGEDFDLWVRVALKYPVAFLNKPLANYNQDVELSGRAIGEKLYKPEEHMLFTDYGNLNNNPDFRFLFERLAVYGLLPYYLAGRNKRDVQKILATIDWAKHELKYKLYYRILPKAFVQIWISLIKTGSFFKQLIVNS